MAEAVKGPAFYFPSIEKKYGRSIDEWKSIIRSSGLTNWNDLMACSRPSTAWVTVTPTLSSLTP
jgi:Domain of unknown function (DUF4287)